MESCGTSTSLNHRRNSAASSRLKFPAAHQHTDARGVVSSGFQHHTNARSKRENAFGSGQIGWLFQPFSPVIVGSMKTMAADMLVLGQLSKRALKLLSGKIESIVLDFLVSLFESVQEKVDFAQIPENDESSRI